MRKVYHNEKSTAGLAVSILASLAFTLLMFCALPFAHRIAKPERGLELRKATTADLPPPAEEEKPPEIAEEEKPPDTAPEPQLADMSQPAIPLSTDLEVATGEGGFLAGFGNILSMTEVKEEMAADAFDVGDLEKAPQPMYQVAPAYPQQMARAKIEGKVTVVFVLTEEGRVEDPRVETSSQLEFEKPALEAIRKWRFRPGEKDGKAVRSYIRVPMLFQIPRH